MYTVVRKSEATARKIAENKTAFNFITKEISPAVSLAVIEATSYDEQITAEYNWIYYVIEGVMTLSFRNKTIDLQVGDSCYVTKSEIYQMKGTFRSIIVSQPAFGT